MSERTNTPTPRTNEAISQAMINNPYSMVKSMKECRDAWQFMAAKLEDKSEELERELQGFCKVLGCTGLTPSGNVEAAMQKLLEMQRDLVTVTAERDALRKALQRITDCDWVVTLSDRMDGVHAIVKVAVDAAKEGEAAAMYSDCSVHDHGFYDPEELDETHHE